MLVVALLTMKAGVRMNNFQNESKCGIMMCTFISLLIASMHHSTDSHICERTNTLSFVKFLGPDHYRVTNARSKYLGKKVTFFHQNINIYHNDPKFSDRQV